MRAIRRRLEREVDGGKYYSEKSMNADHVAFINSNCGSRVRKFIRSLKGNREADPNRVQKDLVCRYCMLGDDGVNTGKDRIASLHQRADESFEHDIRQTQKLTIVCNGQDDMHEELTS
jgi:hypothetical protein